MSFLARLFGPRAAIRTSHDLLTYLLGERHSTDSGVDVTPDSAMRVAAVYACVRAVSEDMAKLPLITYRRLERGKERATDYWLTDLLDEPNPFQTGFEFRELMQAHVELCGNAYALKTVVGEKTRELLPVDPTRVKVSQLPGWKLAYELTNADGTTSPVPAERMFHLRGLSLDGGLTGVSPIEYQRETIGLAISQVKHGARLFRNGAMVGGVLEKPEGMLSKEAAQRLKESFDEKYSGVDNAGKTILLEEGVKFSKIGLSAIDAQWIESRKFSRSEIAGMFRIPPHKVMDLDRSTYSNIEQQGREYVTDTLHARFTRWEKAIRKNLIPKADRKRYFVEHLADALMRGDSAARGDFYAKMFALGAFSPNDILELENRNPVEGGDQRFVPLNMVPLEQASDVALAASRAKPAPPPKESA